MWYVLKVDFLTLTEQEVSVRHVSLMKGKGIMKKIFALTFVALLLTGLVYFSPVASAAAHASTLKLSVNKNSTPPQGCFQINQNNRGWGTVSGMGGTQLNLNGLFFGATNNCGVDAVRGSWSIRWAGTCPSGTSGGGTGVVKEGTFGLMPAGDFDKFFGGSIIFKCVFVHNPSAYTPPSAATVALNVSATMSGGFTRRSNTLISWK